MNKEEFLKKLRKRLDVLENSEIEDIVSEYEGYIDEKVAKGLSEEEAVKELGDFEEIINDLLAAYKVKSSASEDNSFSGIINKISHGIDNIMETLSHKSGTDIIRLLIEIIIILFIICLLKIPFGMIKDLGGDIFRELAHPIGNIFKAIWYFIIDFSYIIISIIFFIKMLERRYFKNISNEIIETVEEETTKSSAKKSKKKVNIKEEEPKSKPASKTNQVIVEKTPNHSILDALVNLCILFLKFIVLMILFGIICCLIGMAFAIGFMIYLLITGVQYYGILILLIAMFMGCELFLRLGINFLFNKKNRATLIAGQIIAIVILTGLGLSMSAVEIANTEIIYTHNNYATKKITKEIPMIEDLKIYNYDKIVIADINDDIIKIEYTYPDFQDNLEIEIDLVHHKDGYWLSTNVNRIRLGKNIIKTFSENLKDKKIYIGDYDIEKVIYVSEANYNKLKRNSYKYDIETRNYTVLNMTEHHDNYYSYLTLKDLDNEEVATVRVAKNLASNIELNQEYSFTFEIDHYAGEDIYEMFRENNLISITKAQPPVFE